MLEIYILNKTRLWMKRRHPTLWKRVKGMSLFRGGDEPDLLVYGRIGTNVLDVKFP